MLSLQSTNMDIKDLIPNLLLSIIGLAVVGMAIKLTLAIKIGTPFFFLIGIQGIIGLYLLYALLSSFRSIWIEYRWKPSKLR